MHLPGLIVVACICLLAGWGTGLLTGLAVQVLKPVPAVSQSCK